MEEYRSNNIKRLPDGSYQWEYGMSMFRNATIITSVIKALCATLLVMFLILGIPMGCTDGWDGIVTTLTGVGIVAGIFVVLMPFAYLLLAAIYGGKYQVQFTMDEHQVLHQQMAEQHKRVRKMAFFGMLLGLFTKNRGGFSTSVMVATKPASVSEWSKVISVKPDRKHHVIYVNEKFEKNQVYAADEDFDFVYGYIMEHCKHIKG